MVSYVETDKKWMEPCICIDTTSNCFRYTQVDRCDRMAYSMGTISLMDAMGFIGILIFLH